jgi:hypothetical protein
MKFHTLSRQLQWSKTTHEELSIESFKAWSTHDPLSFNLVTACRSSLNLFLIFLTRIKSLWVAAEKVIFTRCDLHLNIQIDVDFLLVLLKDFSIGDLFSFHLLIYMIMIVVEFMLGTWARSCGNEKTVQQIENHGSAIIKSSREVLEHFFFWFSLMAQVKLKFFWPNSRFLLLFWWHHLRISPIDSP